MILSRRIASVIAVVVAVSCVTSAFASTSASAKQSVSVANSPIDLTSTSGKLRGSGSTFADRYYKAVIVILTKKAKMIRIDYRPIGSGRGKSEFGRNVTDFAGTDSLVKNTDGPKAGEYLYFPTTAAAITVAYRLNGVDDLKLSAPTIAKIFQRDVTRWNDPAIAAENPDANLPNKPIGVVHRADRSGTTSNFTKYLNTAAAGVWRLGAGDAVRWPAATSQGDGNRRVAQILENNNASIGYVDLANADAFGLTYAAIRNKAGVYVRPTTAGVTAALAKAQFADDLTYQPLDADGADSYPLTAPTFILTRTSYKNQETVDLVKSLLTYILTDGQDLAVRVDYARLPDDLRQRALAQLDQITVGP